LFLADDRIGDFAALDEVEIRRLSPLRFTHRAFIATEILAFAAALSLPLRRHYHSLPAKGCSASR